MPYVTQSQIEAEIPSQLLNNALDDDGDGVADDGLLEQIIANASVAVDSYLAGLFDVPFSEPPAVVRDAAFIFACETIYSRRLASGDKNPFTTRANNLRERLEKIGQGEMPLDATLEKKFTPGAAVTEAAKLDSTLA